jgi:hypothetical protein
MHLILLETACNDSLKSFGLHIVNTHLKKTQPVSPKPETRLRSDRNR